MPDPAFDADVAIIGYGPSGVTAASVLGSRGIRTVVFERAKDIYARARAVTVNDWTMRCFQSLGLDDALKAGMDETLGLRWITYDGHVVNQMRFPPGMSAMGHAHSFSIYQPIMEQTLRDGAARYSDHVTLRFGAEVTDIRQDADGVTLTSTDTSDGTVLTTRARYALACDGGSSATRERLGVKMIGDTLDTRWVIIDAKVKRWWPSRHILTFWSDRARPVVDIALSMGNHRWELPLRPEESDADFDTHDKLWRVLEPMGVTRDDIDIHQHAFYKHHIRHAERWREGRVFLLGDAAHLMPPWAGNGMQSGIRDAFNIGWKLIEVLGDRLPPSVLDTYEIERAPDVERYTQMSIGLGRIIKQELSPEEIAAMQAASAGPDAPSPLLELPALTAGWVTGDAGETSAVGKIIPQYEVATNNGLRAMFDAVIGNGFVLLGDGVDPRALMTTDQIAGWDRLNADYRVVASPDRRSEYADDIIDLHGRLGVWMRGYGARVIALRPDRFVAAADPTGLSVPG